MGRRFGFRQISELVAARIVRAFRLSTEDDPALYSPCSPVFRCGKPVPRLGE